MRYFVSYVITRPGAEPKYGWEEVLRTMPVTGETALKGLGRQLVDQLVNKEWINIIGDNVSIVNWRRFEAPE